MRTEGNERTAVSMTITDMIPYTSFVVYLMLILDIPLEG